MKLHLLILRFQLLPCALTLSAWTADVSVSLTRNLEVQSRLIFKREKEIKRLDFEQNRKTIVTALEPGNYTVFFLSGGTQSWGEKILKSEQVVVTARDRALSFKLEFQVTKVHLRFDQVAPPVQRHMSRVVLGKVERQIDKGIEDSYREWNMFVEGKVEKGIYTGYLLGKLDGKYFLSVQGTLPYEKERGLNQIIAWIARKGFTVSQLKEGDEINITIGKSDYLKEPVVNEEKIDISEEIK